jgi:hypothetical protein
MRVLLDDLAAFLMHRTSDESCSPDQRLRIYAAVDAYQDGRDVEPVLRREATAFSGHPDYRPEWREPGATPPPRPDVR